MLYLPRWKYPYNLGDSVRFSSLFKVLRSVHPDSYIEVVTDEFLIDGFEGDLYVNKFRLPSYFEKKIPTRFWARSAIGRGNGAFLKLFKTLYVRVHPSFSENYFKYLSQGSNLKKLINDPSTNIISTSYCWQLGDDYLAVKNKSSEIILSNKFQPIIPKNSIGICIATRRNSSKTYIKDNYRVSLKNWKLIAEGLRKRLPGINIIEVGSDKYHNIGDQSLLGVMQLKELLINLNRMTCLLVTDGGIYNACHSINKKVVLFQGAEYLEPDIHKMRNAYVNESYHLECRKTCDYYAKIFNLVDPKPKCGFKCMDLNIDAIVEDVVMLYNS